MDEIEIMTVEIDSAAFDALFNGLTASKLRAAWKKGLKPSAQILELGVLESLYSHHPRAFKYASELKVKIWTKGGGYTVGLSTGQLSISMSKSGDMIDYSHMYILRWLAMGTSERYTKRGFRRGRIIGSHFFAKGIANYIEPAIERIGRDITQAFEQAQAKARASK